MGKQGEAGKKGVGAVEGAVQRVVGAPINHSAL